MQAMETWRRWWRWRWAIWLGPIVLVSLGLLWLDHAVHVGEGWTVSPATVAPPDGAGLPPGQCGQVWLGTGPVRLTHGCVTRGSDAPPRAPVHWRAVALPHRWATTDPGYEGTMWYRFDVRTLHPMGATWALYLPRVVMNAQVWLNGIPLAYTGSMSAPVTRNWYRPLMVQIPADAWRVGNNIVELRVVSGYASRNGVAAIQLGPMADLSPAYQLRTLLQVDGAWFANAILMAMGGLMVIVWWRDREQRAIGYQGAAAVLWGLGNLSILAPNPIGPLVWWETMSFTALVWAQVLTCLFFWHFVGRRRRLFDVLAYAILLIAPLLAIWVPSTSQVALTFSLVYVFMILSVAHALYVLVRTHRRDGQWLVAGYLAAVPAAAHDLAFQLNWLPFDSIYVLPFAGPMLMGCVFYILAGDYGRSRRQLNRLNANLASTVAAREAALRESFERLAELEQAQAVSAERSRILRDMHDGVGAHLTSALRQLQAGGGQSVDVSLVTQTLRDSLDQLKLSVDALSLTEGDVTGLLASLRFRVAPRLRAAGVELLWEVDDLPPWPDGQAPALRQLQYILFEGLSNVLQHSGATRLVLSARDRGDHLLISLIDNGQGREGSGEGLGLQTIRARAGAIGAVVHLVDQAEGGTALHVWLPLSVRHSDWPDLSSAA
jgi:signal transduction histidine kinase